MTWACTPRGGKRFGVEAEVADHVAGEADGVGLVVDRELPRVAELVGVGAQDAHARRVERRHPHRARDRPDQRADALAHLVGGLVGERDGEDRDGCTPSSIRWAMRWVSTRVLPEPAPATTSSGPPRWTTASSWSGLSPESAAPDMLSPVSPIRELILGTGRHTRSEGVEGRLRATIGTTMNLTTTATAPPAGSAGCSPPPPPPSPSAPARGRARASSTTPSPPSRRAAAGWHILVYTVNDSSADLPLGLDIDEMVNASRSA